MEITFRVHVVRDSPKHHSLLLWLSGIAEASSFLYQHGRDNCLNFFPTRYLLNRYVPGALVYEVYLTLTVCFRNDDLMAGQLWAVKTGTYRSVQSGYRGHWKELTLCVIRL